MRYVCLWSPGWSTGAGLASELTASFLEVVPRVVVEGRGVVWADIRGLPGAQVAEELLALATAMAAGDDIRAGLAAVPIVAEVAARGALEEGISAGGARARNDPALYPVDPGRERDFLAPFPLALLAFAACRSDAPSRTGASSRGRRLFRTRGGVAPGPDQRLLALLDGVGLHCCGELAALDPEAVEVRFGAAGVQLWRLARADDSRYLFPPILPERPHASLDFIDYLVTDPERLVFTINALLESVTAALRARGEHAGRLLLTLSLADGGVWRRSLRSARPTASREVWLRLVRGVLERSSIPDAVAGVALAVEAVEPAAVRQGDLFDRGFATAGAVEAALARLLEYREGVLVEPRSNAHPLPERRVAWDPVDPFRQHGVQPARGRGKGPGAGTPTEGPHLSLSLLSEPLPIDVETGGGSDRGAPLRYRDRAGWNRVITAAGPDRISGGQWEEAYAREYFRCVNEEGALVWLFRDARRGAWFLHGWWE